MNIRFIASVVCSLAAMQSVAMADTDLLVASKDAPMYRLSNFRTQAGQFGGQVMLFDFTRTRKGSNDVTVSVRGKSSSGHVSITASITSFVDSGTMQLKSLFGGRGKIDLEIFLVQSHSWGDGKTRYAVVSNAARQKVERYIEIINGLDERLARQKVIVLTSVQLTKQIRSRRMQRTALTYMAKYHPEEPLFSLMLLDYYFPTRQYEEALASLVRLHDRLDVEDAAMEARLSAATLVMGNNQDAEAHAERALRLDPGLELAWWSALRSRAALADFPRAVEALTRLEDDFGYELKPAALDKDPGLKDLLASEDYSGWLASRAP